MASLIYSEDGVEGCERERSIGGWRRVEKVAGIKVEVKRKFNGK